MKQLKNSTVEECNSDLEASCASMEYRKRQESVKLILKLEESRRKREIELENVSEEEYSHSKIEQWTFLFIYQN